MMTHKEITALVATLPELTLGDKIALVEELGLEPAYCPQCLCTAGSPYCHSEITPILMQPAYRYASDEEKFRITRCPSPCPAKADDDPDDDEEEGA